LLWLGKQTNCFYGISYFILVFHFYMPICTKANKEILSTTLSFSDFK